MATDATDPQPSGDAPPKKPLNPMVTAVAAVVIGLVVGGAAGAFVAGPALAKGIAPDAGMAARGAHGTESGEHGEMTEEAEEADAEEEGAAEGGEEKEGEAAAPTYVIDNLVLNPAGSNGTRFLLVTVSLELKNAGLTEEMKRRDAEVRDVVLKVLGAKTVEQLSDVATREPLKDEMRLTVARVFKKKNAVSRVYFPQFVIQ